MMLNKMPGMLPEVIKDCHKVLDRVEGIDMDSPQVAQMVQAIREVRRQGGGGGAQAGGSFLQACCMTFLSSQRWASKQGMAACAASF